MISRFDSIAGSIERLQSISSINCGSTCNLHIVGSDKDECLTTSTEFESSAGKLLNTLHLRGFSNLSILYAGPNIPSKLIEDKISFRCNSIDICLEFDNNYYHDYISGQVDLSIQERKLPNLVFMFNAGLW